MPSVALPAWDWVRLGSDPNLPADSVLVNGTEVFLENDGDARTPVGL